MKLKFTSLASLFAVIAAAAFNASAATDTPADTKAKAEAEKGAPQEKMRSHSHVEEKTGFPQKTPEAKPDKPSPARDWTKHFHPRDGK